MYCSHRLPTTLPHEKHRTGMIWWEGGNGQGLRSGIERGREREREGLPFWDAGMTDDG